MNNLKLSLLNIENISLRNELLLKENGNTSENRYNYLKLDNETILKTYLRPYLSLFISFYYDKEDLKVKSFLSEEFFSTFNEKEKNLYFDIIKELSNVLKISILNEEDKYNSSIKLTPIIINYDKDYYSVDLVRCFIQMFYYLKPTFKPYRESDYFYNPYFKHNLTRDEVDELNCSYSWGYTEVLIETLEESEKTIDYLIYRVY